MTKSPSLVFRDSLVEVNQLLAIHKQLTGTGPGRRHKVEVLNKSAILFACAAFEAFVEDLAKRALDHFIRKAKAPIALPKRLRQKIAHSVRDDKNELRMWDLAGEGWRTLANDYKAVIVSKYIGPFNTPKPGNIETLFDEMIGLQGFAKHWTWYGMKADGAKKHLKKFVELRGALAHGAKPAPVVGKKDVTAHVQFLAPLSVRMSNTVRDFCHAAIGEYPWKRAHYGRVR
jgi:hypothetical protein